MIGVIPLAVCAGVLGLAIGSFLNVVICRVPLGESVVSPPSRCPSCGAGIRTRHNVPVLGWLVLRGRCYDCAAPIGSRYPLVELGTGLLFAAVTARFAGLHLVAALPAFLYLVAAGVALAAIDLDHQRLPDRIVLPSYPVTAALLTGASSYTHAWWPLARAGIGAAALLAFYLALHVLSPGGMGLGDVKLAGVLGALLAYVSWSALVIGTFAAFLLGALTGTLLLATSRGTRKTAVPFGPFLLAGTLVALFAAGPLAGAYLHLA